MKKVSFYEAYFSKHCFCQAQPQLQRWLRLVLISISPPTHLTKKYQFPNSNQLSEAILYKDHLIKSIASSIQPFGLTLFIKLLIC